VEFFLRANAWPRVRKGRGSCAFFAADPITVKGMYV
jgi:hypothetical protein